MTREELRRRVKDIYDPLRQLLREELKAAEIAELKTYLWAGVAVGNLELALQSLEICLEQLDMPEDWRWRKTLEKSL